MVMEKNRFEKIYLIERIKNHRIWK